MFLPQFLGLIPGGALLDAPAALVYDMLDDMDFPDNEIPRDAATQFYDGEVLESDFGLTEAMDTDSDEDEARTQKSMMSTLRLGQDQMYGMLSARDAGAPGAYDAAMLQFYAR